MVLKYLNRDNNKPTYLAVQDLLTHLQSLFGESDEAVLSVQDQLKACRSIAAKLFEKLSATDETFRRSVVFGGKFWTIKGEVMAKSLFDKKAVFAMVCMIFEHKLPNLFVLRLETNEEAKVYQKSKLAVSVTNKAKADTNKKIRAKQKTTAAERRHRREEQQHMKQGGCITSIGSTTKKVHALSLAVNVAPTKKKSKSVNAQSAKKKKVAPTKKSTQKKPKLSNQKPGNQNSGASIRIGFRTESKYCAASEYDRVMDDAFGKAMYIGVARAVQYEKKKAAKEKKLKKAKEKAEAQAKSAKSAKTLKK